MRWHRWVKATQFDETLGKEVWLNINVSVH